MTTYTWPIEDVREITGCGGAIENAARAAVAAGAKWIDDNPHAVVMFDRDEYGMRRVVTSDAAEMLAAVRAASDPITHLSAMVVELVLRHLQRYWFQVDHQDRWRAYIDTMKPIDGLCRFCGEALNAKLDGWVERTRCVRCVATRERAKSLGLKLGGES